MVGRCHRICPDSVKHMSVYEQSWGAEQAVVRRQHKTHDSIASVHEDYTGHHSRSMMYAASSRLMPEA